MKYKITYEVQAPGKGIDVKTATMKVKLPLNSKARMAEAETYLSKIHGGLRVEIAVMEITEYDNAKTA